MFHKKTVVNNQTELEVLKKFKNSSSDLVKMRKLVLSNPKDDKYACMKETIETINNAKSFSIVLTTLESDDFDSSLKPNLIQRQSGYFVAKLGVFKKEPFILFEFYAACLKSKVINTMAKFGYARDEMDVSNKNDAIHNDM